jgi:hypothetical protein
VKCAWNVEESKLNNLFSSSLSLYRGADLELTTFSLEREYSLGKRMLKTPGIMYNVLLINHFISGANVMTSPKTGEISIHTE